MHESGIFFLNSIILYFIFNDMIFHLIFIFLYIFFLHESSGYALEDLWEVKATMIVENYDLCVVLKFINGWF